MKLDRLIGILSILLQREKVTAPELAARFEVSRRTIQRDVEALCRAGIPIATAQGAGGGISILEGYRVDRTLLTAPEMQAILAGLRSLDSVSGTRRYAQLMEKLCAGAGTLVPGSADLLIDLSSWYKDSLAPKIELIQDAIRRRRTVRFCYFSPKGESRRTVEPCYLVFHWSAWYLWGRCRTREDYRLFKLNRMTGLSAGEPFEPRSAPLPDSVSGTRRYAQLMEKLCAGAGTLVPGSADLLIDLSSWYKDSLAPKIELIQDAIRRRRTVRFCYFSPKGESRRTVEPCYLVFHWSAWYLWGRCRTREDYRLFKLNRMTGLSAGEPFEPRSAPLPDLAPERVFPEKYRVTVLFDPAWRWRLVEEYGADGLTQEPDGRLRFTGGFPDADSVLGWVLTFGEGAELVEPAELRQKLRSLTRSLAERYEGRN